MTKEYEVIRIIDNKTIVINCGEKDNIEIGDKIKIYEPGVELIDANTKESYGRLNTTKVIVTVVDTMPKMCICKKRNFKYKNMLNPLDNFTKTIIDDEAIDVEISQIENGLSDNLTVKLGDKATIFRKASENKSTND